MTIDDITECMEVVSFFNPNMRSLHDTFLEQTALIDDNQDAVEAADGAGRPIYEALIALNVQLANAVHDYVYNVVHPFDSVIVKNIIREQVCREIFGLDANF